MGLRPPWVGFAYESWMNPSHGGLRPVVGSPRGLSPLVSNWQNIFHPQALYRTLTPLSYWQEDKWTQDRIRTFLSQSLLARLCLAQLF